ncbi:MAG: CheR family methyltransferase [Pirellulales bacterium]
MTGQGSVTILRDVQRLLQQRIGLSPDSLGTTAIESAVVQHVQALSGLQADQYLDLIRANGEEFDELVERIVVPETWFFRDAASFECLRHYMRQRRATVGLSPRPLRLLSIPCSTGEEAYSLAAVMADEGFSSSEFQVLGVDISRRLLRLAREGRYGANSFRQLSPAGSVLVDRFLSLIDGDRVVGAELKRSVSFERGNLATDDFLAGQSPMDVIFCRNLLIYLDDAARRVALMHVRRLLAPGGLLYVGHAEAGAVTDSLSGTTFQRYHQDFPFGWIHSPGHLRADDRFDARAISPGQREHSPAAPSISSRPPASFSGVAGGGMPTARTVGPLPTAGTLTQRTPTQRTPTQRTPTPASRAKESGSAKLLSEARAAADRGELDRAATICQRLLDESNLQAEVYCLLGVVRQAAGQAGEAERLFAQALFLEPRNVEALTHLMVLKSSQGDEQAASNYRRRLAAAGQEHIG